LATVSLTISARVSITSFCISGEVYFALVGRFFAIFAHEQIVLGTLLSFLCQRSSLKGYWWGSDMTSTTIAAAALTFCFYACFWFL
jgi:hypothetical protein